MANGMGRKERIGRNGEAGKQIKERREAQGKRSKERGREKLGDMEANGVFSPMIPEVCIRTHNISANPKTGDLFD